MVQKVPYSEQFPRARVYAAMVGAMPGCVRETTARRRAFPYTERHVQCVWFDSAIRPRKLVTDEGEILRVESPGRWNLEAGPDFLGAVLRIGPHGRRLEGDVEIHVRPDDWRHHGHAGDRRYSQVVAHVTYFPGQIPENELPAGTIQCALAASLLHTPSFSFENIDITAYPFATRHGTAPRCNRLMASRSADEQLDILDAAGEARMRSKAERIAYMLDSQPAEEVFYIECMCALGYKHNRVPFRQLASRLSLRQLRRAAADEPLTAYALLLGVAGLLPPTTRTGDSDANTFIRSLWDRWWKMRNRWEPRAMSTSAWVLANQRPHNHPLRRMAGAASLFASPNSPYDTIRALPTASPQHWFKALRQYLDAHTRGIDFWSHRLTLDSKRSRRPAAILGRSRIASVVTNLIVPMLAAEGRPIADLIPALPAGEDNALIRQTAHSLFGPDHNPACYRTGLRQQGLLQIFHDFCLDSSTECAECLLAAALESGTSKPARYGTAAATTMETPQTA